MSVARQREEILRLIAAMRGDPARIAALVASPNRNRKERHNEREDRRWRRRPGAPGRRGGKEEPSRDGRDGRLLLRLHRLERRIEQLESAESAGTEPQAAPALSASVAERATRLEQSTLGGRVKEGLLADVLQMVAANQFSGIFTVLSDAGTVVDVVFVEGEIQHALGDGLSGEAAFFAAMQVEHGFFFFDETRELPAEKTIEAKAQYLILEALRKIDESQAGGAKE